MTGYSAERAQTYAAAKDADVEKKEEEARSYFERTGSYRAEDVIDILGDPRDHVDINPIDTSLVASWTDD